MRKTFVVAGCLVALGGVVTGCGASNDASSGKGGSGDKQAAVKPAKGLTIGVSDIGLSFPFPAAISQGIKQEASKMGVKIVELDPKNDTNKQSNDIQDLISQKVDGVVFNPVDGGVGVGMVKRLKAAGIPVVAVNSQVGDPKKVGPTYVDPDLVAWVAQDEVESGAVAGKLAAQQFPNGAKTAVVEGQAGFSAVKLRLDGFKKGLGDASKFPIVASQPGDWVQDKSEAACKNMLAAKPDIQLFYAEADDMAVGCQRAVQSAGSKAKVIGIGGSKLAVQAIGAGKLFGTVCFKPVETGQIALRTLVDHLTGKATKSASFVPLPATATTTANATACPGQW